MLKKFILLVTDGARNAGYIDDQTAAYLAAEKSIPVYYKKYDNLTNASDSTNSGFGYAQGLDIFWRDKKTIDDVILTPPCPVIC